MLKGASLCWFQIWWGIECVDLEAYIDHHYSQCIMDTTPNTAELDPVNPYRRKKISSTNTSNLPQTTEIKVSILCSINTKLDLLVTLHNEIKELCSNLDFAHNNNDNNSYSSPTNLQSKLSAKKMDLVITENKIMKEIILDIQSRSMRDNLIFSGIPGHPSDSPETQIKDFMTTQLKLPPNTVKHFTFHCVRCLGSRINTKST